jgi:hypothetical protein
MEETQKLMDANPGMYRSTAMELLRRQRPEFFDVDKRTAALDVEERVREKQQAIRDAIKEMQQKEPHLTFQLAWNRLMKEQPALFDFEES